MSGTRMGIRILRVIWKSIILLINAVLLIAAAVQACKGQYALLLPAGIVLAVTGLASTIVFYWNPSVYLDEQGVWMRVWFFKRLYPWASICQAGVLWLPVWGATNHIVLLKQGGSPRKDRDRGFLLRNFGKVIFVTNYSEQVLQYITEHYGPLDFDLADKKEEVPPKLHE